MRLSTRCEYGLLALIDLAAFSRGRALHAKQIAERQGIPKQYLDQLMIDLKKAGLVVSLRGRQGGYQLARPAGAITLWEAIATFEVPLDATRFTVARGIRGQSSRKVLRQFWDDACTNRATDPQKGNESAGLDSIIKGNCGPVPLIGQFWTVAATAELPVTV